MARDTICAKCATINSETSLFCSKCGIEINRFQNIPNEELPPIPKTTPPVKNAAKIKRNNVVVFVILGIVVCCFGVFTIVGSLSSVSKNTGDANMASVQCRNYVRDRLKSPSTANFPWDSAQSVGNNTYEMYSYVDAQNGFGATIRNNFYCKIQYTGGDVGNQSSWSVLSLDIQ